MAVASMNRMKHPPRAIHQQLSAISSRTIIIGLMLLTFPACGGRRNEKRNIALRRRTTFRRGIFRRPAWHYGMF